MAELLQHAVGYFFRGIKDCFLGALKVYSLDNNTKESSSSSADADDYCDTDSHHHHHVDCSCSHSKGIVTNTKASDPFLQQSVKQSENDSERYRSRCRSKKGPQTVTVLAQRRAAAAAATSATAASTTKKHKLSLDSKINVNISHTVLRCCVLNGVLFWISLFLYDYGIIPILHAMLGANVQYWLWIGPIISVLFSALWVLPFFIISKIVNSLWFQDVADAVWLTKKRRSNLPRIGLLLADITFSITLQTLFLLQSTLANMFPLPMVGNMFSLVHLSILYSMYAFEYRWFNIGWSISRRVAQLEHQWPYFVGFGFPLAYLTWLPQSMFISGCVFSILFPFLIVSAYEAEPIAQKYDFPLHLFAPVMRICSNAFRIFKRE